MPWKFNLNEIKNGSLDDDPPFYVAGIYAIRGHREEALLWLKKATEANWIDYAQIQHGPWFVKYRDDPDVIKLMDVLRKKTEAMRRKAEGL